MLTIMLVELYGGFVEEGMAERRQKCQVQAGRSSKFCKENLGQDSLLKRTHETI